MKMVPVSGMGPDEVERFHRRKVDWIAGVESLMDVEGHAGDAKFLAHIMARTAARHWVANERRFEIKQQILDEIAAAIAWPLTITVLIGTMEMVEAGQVRDRTRISRCEWQPCIDGSVTLLCWRRDPFDAVGIEGIGGMGAHGQIPFTRVATQSSSTATEPYEAGSVPSSSGSPSILRSIWASLARSAALPFSLGYMSSAIQKVESSCEIL